MDGRGPVAREATGGREGEQREMWWVTGVVAGDPRVPIVGAFC